MMFIILAYDVQTARVAKAGKIASKYLHPVQKSVYEGHLTETRIKQLKYELRQILDVSRDSIVIYHHQPDGSLQKESLGKQLWSDEPIL